MSSGWIKLHRKITENPVWQDPRMLKLWIYCLTKATHKEHEQMVGTQIIELQPGQFITGRNALAEEFNKGAKKEQRVSPVSLWRWLRKFEEWQMLNIKITNKYSVVTVKKWDEYQQNEQQVNIKRTSNDQQVNTNKNVKNDKNEKKFISSSSSERETENAFEFYENNFGMIQPFQADLLGQLTDEFGNELVIAAMKIALKKNARHLNFVEKVLMNWKDHNVKTLEDARALEREFMNKKRGANHEPVSKHRGSNGGLEEEKRVIPLSSHRERRSREEMERQIREMEESGEIF